ncbi:MAG: PAS domain S-box protein [Nanoarchaeota archaeon]
MKKTDLDDIVEKSALTRFKASVRSIAAKPVSEAWHDTIDFFKSSKGRYMLEGFGVGVLLPVMGTIGLTADSDNSIIKQFSENYRFVVPFLTGIAGAAAGFFHGKREENAHTAHTALESSLDGFIIANNKGNIKYVNPATARMWGHDSPSDMIGTSILDYWANGSRKEAEKIMGNLRDIGTYAGELTAARKDGSTFTVQYNFAQTKSGIVGSFFDITKRKKAESILQERATSYRNYVESLPYAFYVVDKDLNYRFSNTQYKERRDLSPDEDIAGRNYAEFHTEAQTEEFKAYVETVFKTGKPLMYQHKTEKRESTYSDEKTFHRRLAPMKDPKTGEVIAVTVSPVNLAEIIANGDTLTVDGKKLYSACANCSSIRDNDGNWRPGLEYLSKELQIAISHGVCDKCLPILYPEYAATKK